MLFFGMPAGFGRIADGRECAMEFRPSIMVGVHAVWETVRKGIVGQVQAGGAIRSRVFKGAVEANKRDARPGLARLADSVILSGVRAATAGGGRLRIGRRLATGCAPCAPSCPQTSSASTFVGMPVPSIEITLRDVPEAGYFSCGRLGATQERGWCVLCVTVLFLLFLSSHPSFVLCFVLLVFDFGRGSIPTSARGRASILVENWPCETLQGRTGVVLGERDRSCIAELVWLMRGRVRVRYTGSFVACGVRFTVCIGQRGFCLVDWPPLSASASGRLPWAGSENERFGSCLRSAACSVRCPRRYSRVLDACGNSEVAALVLWEWNAVGKKSGFEAMEALTAVVLTPDEWTPESGLVTVARKIQRSAIAKKFDRETNEAYKNR
ncbi:hypothetical protein C8F04DRAFT_1391688 [Mycena alexandri]|uniref:Uncharacterized protein n=1 Tax=Mycena alexandri TaxID=1745969 RepID=A0AAD6X8G2_9AGAR|nr:hypothetical protein C8F04DRAFT_1391688 [Mycena alexandri]